MKSSRITNEQELREKLPAKADRILNRIREARGGKLNSREFGERMRGRSEQWRVVERMFKLHCERLGFNEAKPGDGEPRKTFRRPTRERTLFE